MSSKAIPSTFLNTVLKNGVGRYVCQLQRLTLKFCKNRANSLGIRNFIENDLLEFVKKNPGTVVYLQPRRHKNPLLVAEYLNGKEHQVRVHGYSQEEVCQWVDHLRTRSGEDIVRLRKRWHTDTPSVQGIWTPYSNRASAINMAQFPSEQLSSFQPTDESSTERLLRLAAELRQHTNVVVEEEAAKP